MRQRPEGKNRTQEIDIYYKGIGSLGNVKSHGINEGEKNGTAEAPFSLPHDVFLSGAALPLFSFYSTLSLCSDRCKSKFRPRVQTLRK